LEACLGIGPLGEGGSLELDLDLIGEGTLEDIGVLTITGNSS